MIRRASWSALSLLLTCSVLASEPPVFNVSTLAGTPGTSGFQDGGLRASTFNRPTWLDVVTSAPAYDRLNLGDIYVIDRANQAIRLITRDGVSTYVVRYPWYAPDGLAGTPIPFNFGGPFGGGLMVEPPYSGCGGGEYDRGMFVAASGEDQVPLVSFVGLPANRDGLFTLGSGMAGTTDGASYSARFRTPTGIARSRGYPGRYEDWYTKRFIYIADTGNHTIRRVGFTISFEGCPQPIRIETLAGSPELAGYADGAGTAAHFNQPRGLATAPDGSLLVADSGNHVIRRIDVDGKVTTIAGEPGVSGSNDGPARQAHLNQPSGVDVNERGEVFIADTGNHTIRMLTIAGTLVTIAGTPGLAGYADGAGSAARFSGPVGIRIAPDGSLVVADTSNNVIRRLTPTPSHRRPALR